MKKTKVKTKKENIPNLTFPKSKMMKFYDYYLYTSIVSFILYVLSLLIKREEFFQA